MHRNLKFIQMTNLFSTDISVGSVTNTYEICIYISILYGDNNDPNLPSTETSLDELLVGESGCADKASLSKVCLESESENETDISKVSIV